MVGSSDFVRDFGQVAHLHVFDPRSFAPVAGAGGETFGRPSAFGGLAVTDDGTPLALGIGPVDRPVDDWLLAILTRPSAQPIARPRSYPGSTDRQERAGGLVFTRKRALLIGAAGDSGIPDVPKIGAVDASSGSAPCSLTAPPNTTKPNDPGRPGAAVTYPLPTTTGLCGPINCSPASGSFFGIGVTEVTCTTQDASGATVTASFQVTVSDTEPPKIAAVPDVTLAPRNRNGRTVGFLPPAATDNSGAVTVVCSPPSGTRFKVGTTVVTCTATDPSGNTTTSSFAIRITKFRPPVVKTSPATGSAEVSLAAPGPGRVTVTATADSAALKASASRRVTVAKARRTVRKAGRVRLTLRPSGAAKRVLRRKGRLPVVVKVTFTPRSGAATTTTQKVTLRLRRR
jgi:hypothetical protein